MKIAFSFNYDNRVFYSVMEDGDVVTIGSGLYDHHQISALKEKQFTLEMHQGNIYLSGKEPYKVDRYLIPNGQLVPLNKKHNMYLYATNKVGVSEKKALLPFSGQVTIGRSDKNNIITSFDFMSREHLVLSCKEGIVTLKSLSQSNGTFVNGVLVREKELKSGDVISIFTFRMTYFQNQLVFDNCANRITVGHIEGTEGKLEQPELEVGLNFHRSPRIQSQLPSEQIILSSPPNPAPQFQKSRNMFMQMLSTGTMFATSMMMSSMASPAFMAARALSLVTPLASMGMQKGQEKKRKKELEEYERLRKELYGKYIDDQTARITSTANRQRQILQEENPSPKECLAMVDQLKRNLWERTSRDRDFLDIRLGMGYEKLCVEVKGGYNEQVFQMDQNADVMKHLANEIIADTEYVDNVPSRLKLREFNAVGIVGSRQKVINQVRNMIVSLSATHFYKDVKIVGIFDDNEREFWESIKWIPHVFDDDQESRFLAFNKKEADILCERMNDMLENRKRSLSENNRNQSVLLPHYIFILGSKRYVKDQLMMQNLLMNRKELGISSLFLFNDLAELPQECQYIINMDEHRDQQYEYGGAYERTKMDEKFLFTIDANIDNAKFDNFTRRMSAINVDGFAEKLDIPDSVTFLEGYGVDRVDQLQSDRRWARPRDSETLAAPIGVMRGGKLFSLDADEKAHGSHGLLAGTTGSGKSELLQSWILSMAVNYHPHDVSFVLVDYKGGGMSGQFEGLPHVIGEITNIGEGIERAFIALESENLRRESIFKKYDVNSISKYHKLYRNGQATEILPQLIIVVDEFAMMKKEKPDSISRLVKIATVGRSLGIHLLLATQSPGGVVDDLIKNNSNFNLCLKVQSAADSRDLLKTSDAANLRTVGRAYVRVGNNEVYEMFQSFWSGAPYFTNGKKPTESVNRVRLLATDGTRVEVTNKEKKKVSADSDELREIVNYLAKTAKEMNIEPVDSLWMPELPTNIPLDSLERNVGFDGTKWRGSEKWLRVPIGKFDLPEAQRQGVQYIDFNKDGHLGIYGAPQSGKTNLIKTLVYSMALNFSPEEVHIYGIDCNSGSTSILANFPHVGGVARDGESEKVQKLVQMVKQELDERKKLFLKNNVNTLSDYREAISKDIPAWFIFIDNLPALLELYPELEEFLITLSSSGSANGIYMIYTANNSSSVKFKIQTNIKNAVAFELIDRGDYAGIVGRPSHALPALTGRAFVKGTPPLMIQASLYKDGENEFKRSRNLLETAQAMSDVYQGPGAKKIPIMPEVINMADLLGWYKQKNILPLGLSYKDMEPVYTDLSGNYTFLVSGMAHSGKSRYLENMAGLMKQKYPEMQLYVFDGLRSSLADCEEYATGYSKCSDDSKVTEIIGEIVTELSQRRVNLKNASLGLAFNQEDWTAEQTLIGIIIDDVSEFMKNVNEGNKKKLRAISKQAQGLGVVMLMAGRVGDLQNLNEENPIVHDWIVAQKGLVFSGTVGMHSFFENSLSYQEKGTPLKEGEAYLVDKGELIKMKPAG